MGIREKERRALYRMVFTALMAAVVFVTTSFIKINIMTPVGPTMLKSGNIFCLLAGMLFGGVPGGLAAGIGSMLYDLMDPLFVADAPLTLIRFGLMGALCGWICHSGGARGTSWKRNLIGAVAASLFSFLFYIVKSVGELVLMGSAFYPAVVACVPKMVTSGINYLIAIVCSMLLVFPLSQALRRTGLLEKL